MTLGGRSPPAMHRQCWLEDRCPDQLGTCAGRTDFARRAHRPRLRFALGKASAWSLENAEDVHLRHLPGQPRRHPLQRREPVDRLSQSAYNECYLQCCVRTHSGGDQRMARHGPVMARNVALVRGVGDSPLRFSSGTAGSHAHAGGLRLPAQADAIWPRSRGRVATRSRRRICFSGKMTEARHCGMHR